MNTTTLPEEFAQYLWGKGLSQNVQTQYSYSLNGYLDFLSGQGRKPGAATLEDIKGYLGKRRGEGLANGSLHLMAVALRHFHRFLVEKGYAQSDPTKGTQILNLKAQRQWTSKFYLIVAGDGLPDAVYRTIYRTPETPLGILERLGASAGNRLLEFDVEDGRAWSPQGGQP